MSAPSERVVPNDIEAEQHLLGAFLCNNRLLEYAEILQPLNFYNASHGRIFEQLQKFTERGEVADPVTLKAIFDRDPGLEDKGGARYLVVLARAGAMRADRIEIEQLRKIVRDCSLDRELILLLDEHLTAAWRHSPCDPPEARIERLEAELHRLAESGRPGAGFQPLDTMMEKALVSGEEAYKRGDGIAGVPTGFVDLDRALGGLHPSDMVVLAARPSMGKTALAENIARKAAKVGKAIGFFSLEMSGTQLTGRTLAGEAGVPADWMRRPAEFRQHVDKLVDAKQQLSRLPVYIDDTPALSVATMHARARRLKRQHGLDLIVTDYLQLAHAPRPEGRSEQNRVQEVGEISSGLKRIAKELEVPVLALSQLSRAVEERPDKRPLLSDLRESGSIEQDADVVMFLYREQYYELRREPDKSNEPAHEKWRKKLEAVAGKADVIIAKNRHGPITTVQLHFDERTTQFYNLARGFD
jgi:replicative DNA helicase